MRIHSGTLKGRDIPAPPGTQTRPTTDVIKESMFSVIEHHIDLQGMHVLDLFAGSGQLAWEALSRGAHSATLVDTSSDVCRHLRAVALSFGVSDQVTIIRTDAVQYLRNGEVAPANVVFVDPPYHMRCCNTVIHELHQRNLLLHHSLVVVEHGDQEALLIDTEYTSVWHRERSSTVVDILLHHAPQT